MGVTTTPPPPPTPPSPGPAAPPPANAPAGWFPDPNGRHEHRYFNGQRWTADVADRGQRAVDPLGPGPTPGAPAGQHQSSQAGRNGIATAALVTGIIGVILAWMPFLVVVGFVLAVLALIFGIRGARGGRTTGRGKAVAGIVLGSIGLALSVVGVILSIAVWREAIAYIEPADHDIEVEGCTIADGVATVTGAITNLSSEADEFTVYVEIRPDTGGSPTVRVPELGSLDPGQSTEWTARDIVDPDATSCDAFVDVYGPLPFGVPIEEPPE